MAYCSIGRIYMIRHSQIYEVGEIFGFFSYTNPDSEAPMPVSRERLPVEHLRREHRGGAEDGYRDHGPVNEQRRPPRGPITLKIEDLECEARHITPPQGAVMTLRQS